MQLYREAVLDAAPTGRVFVFSSSHGLHPLLCGLHFPNGIQLTTADSNANALSLLIAESARFRLLKLALPVGYNLTDLLSLVRPLLIDCQEKGSLHLTLSNQIMPNEVKKGLISVYAKELPGFIDNIRLHQPTGLLYVAMGVKSAQPFSLLYTAYQSAFLRRLSAALLPMRYTEMLVPKYGLIGVYNVESGLPLCSLHDPFGRTPFISHAEVHPFTGDLWLGSHSNQFLAILPHQTLPACIMNPSLLSLRPVETDKLNVIS
jgi:hypothetical protein